MNLPRTRLRPLPILLMACLLAAGSAPILAEEPAAAETETGTVPVHLRVQAARGVAELDWKRLQRAVVVRLTTEERCPIRLVEEPEPAVIHVDLKLKRWLDRRTTDGVWKTDPRTGRQVPGMRYEVWGVYDLAIRIEGRKKPLEQWKDEDFRSAAREQKNPLFDAKAEALEEAHDRILDRIAREVCRAARERPSARSGDR
jgi:hypothetical protein